MAPVQLPDVSTVTAVDLARLIERDDAETTRLVEALESPGYFYLDFRNAPATKAIADQARLMYALSENYFEQPAEIKAEDFRQGQPSWSDRGYKSSLSRALATLGYENLYDLDTVANGSPEHAAFWVRAIERKLSGQPGFDGTEAAAFFDGYDGVRNVPAAAFAAELIESYPTSKVILPTRDVDSWHASCLGTVYQRAVDPILGALALIHSGSRTYATLLRALQRALYRGDFPGYGKTAFAEHQDYVRGRVPAERLLEYRVQQGWGPLCEFLGEPVPAGDFPQSNDRDAFWEGCRARDRRVLRELAVKALLVSGTAVHASPKLHPDRSEMAC
ncbi:hypothetical protein ACCO45_013420 [Purpureocillium lilacinum]|uniref:Uncharacterized protein n=1 Tax=Purpureocillium lilacinum TaxID=33203 RepID=A0ACC4D6N4_PURLI